MSSPEKQPIQSTLIPVEQTPAERFTVKVCRVAEGVIGIASGKINIDPEARFLPPDEAHRAQDAALLGVGGDALSENAKKREDALYAMPEQTIDHELRH